MKDHYSQNHSGGSGATFRFPGLSIVKDSEATMSSLQYALSKIIHSHNLAIGDWRLHPLFFSLGVFLNCHGWLSHLPPG